MLLTKQDAINHCTGNGVRIEWSEPHPDPFVKEAVTIKLTYGEWKVKIIAPAAEKKHVTAGTVVEQCNHLLGHSKKMRSALN